MVHLSERVTAVGSGPCGAAGELVRPLARGGEVGGSQRDRRLRTGSYQ